MILTIQGTSDLFLDLELEVTETAAAGLPLRGSQMDATIRDSDGSGKCDLFLSFSPSVSYRQHPSEVHARAAYEAKNFIGWARLALTYPPKLQKRRKLSINPWNSMTMTILHSRRSFTNLYASDHLYVVESSQ